MSERVPTGLAKELLKTARDDQPSHAAVQDNVRESTVQKSTDQSLAQFHSEEEIKTILNTQLWLLSFPPALEKTYRAHALIRSIKTYRFNGLFAMGVFVVICSGVFKLIPASNLKSCTEAYGFAFVIMVGARLLSFIWARWFNWYVTTSSVVMVTAAVYVNSAIPMGAATTLSYIGLTYILFFIYCFVGLRLQLALFASLLGGACGVALTYTMGAAINWQIMPPTFATASLLAIFLAFGLGRQERINYLQSYLLKLSLIKSEQLSREDALTGLANRRYLNEMLQVEWNRMLRQQHPLSVMMIDIDFFKRYNDAVGHLAGDQCLQKIAKLIGQEAHRGGELAARYGGEEFVLLLPDTDADGAQRQAERLLDRIRKAAIPHPDSLGIHNAIVTLSIGIAVTIPDATSSVDQLLRQADAALYHAKAHGKNRYDFF